MKKLFYALVLSLILIIVGCSSNEIVLSQQQMRDMTIREFDANYKTVINSVISVLQDNEYILKSSDFNTGIISAEKKADKSGFLSDQRSMVEVSSKVDSINENKTKVRLLLQERKLYVNYFWGFNTDNVVTIKDKAIYDQLFNNIRVEIERNKISR